MVVGSAIKLLKLLALTLTSVATKTSAQQILYAKIVPGTTLVIVTLVSKGIYAWIQMSALLATAAVLMPHV